MKGGTEKGLILVVDDCRMTRRLLSLYLEEAGYEVETAENGLDALEKLGREPFSLVITDLNMPKMDGVELTRILQTESAYERVPVMVLTTFGDDQEQHRVMDMGAWAFLRKPILQGDFIRKVEHVLAEVEARGSSPPGMVSSEGMARPG